MPTKIEDQLTAALNKPVPKDSAGRYKSVERIFEQLRVEDPIEAQRLAGDLAQKKNPIRTLLDRRLSQLRVPRLIKKLGPQPERGTTARFGADQKVRKRIARPVSKIGDVLPYNSSKKGRAITPYPGGPRANEFEHTDARVNLQKKTRNPVTGISPFDQKAYLGSDVVNIPYDMAREKTAMDLRLRDRIDAGIATQEEMSTHATIERMKAARNITKAKRMMLGRSTADLDLVTDAKIIKATVGIRGKLFEVGKKDDLLKVAKPSGFDEAFKGDWESDSKAPEERVHKTSKNTRKNSSKGKTYKATPQQTGTGKSSRATRMTPGTGSAVFSVAGGFLLSHFKFEERALEKRAEEHGYVPYGKHDPEESKLETVGRFLTDPSLGTGIPMEKRFKPEVWRQKIIDRLKDKRVGDTVTIPWDVFIERKNVLDQYVYGPKHKKVRIKYRKLKSGRWMNLHYGSDSWPKNTVKNPPSLNRILDTTISDEELSIEMGNYVPPLIRDNLA